MKPSIIVTTDFTESSTNALDYAAAISASNYKIILISIYTMPASYSAEGLTLSVVDDQIRNIDTRIEDEKKRILSLYPALNIETKVIIGGFLYSLKEVVAEIQPDAVIMGALKDYADLGTWNSEMLDALTGLSVPVLVVPPHFKTTSIHNIGFACDYRTASNTKQVNYIKTIVKDKEAQLHVVHISRTKLADDPVKRNNEALLHELLEDVSPYYYAIEDPNVIDAIAQFAKDKKLDMLVVVPHKHGFLYSLFNQSHTKQLAKLNHLPVLALPD